MFASNSCVYKCTDVQMMTPLYHVVHRIPFMQAIWFVLASVLWDLNPYGAGGCALTVDGST